MSEQPSYTVRPARKRRGFETVRDMVFSLGAVAVCVAVIMAVTHRGMPNPVKVVNTAAVVTQASSAVSWQVRNPNPRLREWRATSARFNPTSKMLEFGWVTPAGQWAGMQQIGFAFTSQQSKQWVAKVLADSGNANSSIVRGNSDATYLFYGTANSVEMRALLSAAGFTP